MYKARTSHIEINPTNTVILREHYCEIRYIIEPLVKEAEKKRPLTVSNLFNRHLLELTHRKSHHQLLSILLLFPTEQNAFRIYINK